MQSRPRRSNSSRPGHSERGAELLGLEPDGIFGTNTGDMVGFVADLNVYSGWFHHVGCYDVVPTHGVEEEMIGTR
jgi:hypothetical protein